MGQTLMEVSKTIQGNVAVLDIEGSIVGDELGELDLAVDECLSSGIYRVILGLRQAPFIDNAGLERIQNMVSDLGKRGGDLRIAMANEVCKDIFLATRMDSFVQVHDDRESAVRSLL